MAQFVAFRLDLSGLAAIPPSVRRDVFREAIGEAGAWWWKNRLPLHFTNDAYAFFSYTPRQPGYERAKRRRQSNGQGRRAIGEVKPHVFTGESRARALQAMDVRPKAASHSRFYCDVVLNAPAMNFKNPRSAVDQRAEITRITSVERGRMQGVFQLAAIRLFKARGYQHRLVKVIKSAA